MKPSVFNKITLALESQPDNHALQPALENKEDGFHVGMKVGWNSEAGHVTGTITKIHTSDFKVNGYTHHCTEDDPQYEIKSSKTDHIAYHKAKALHAISHSKEAYKQPKLVSLEAAEIKGKKPSGNNPFPDGSIVHWTYRSAVGHGSVVGVFKYGATWDDTEYFIKQYDDHVSKTGSKEKAILKHYGRVLHHGKGPSKKEDK